MCGNPRLFIFINLSQVAIQPLGDPGNDPVRAASSVGLDGKNGTSISVRLTIFS
jgi:hypothetical protein